MHISSANHITFFFFEVVSVDQIVYLKGKFSHGQLTALMMQIILKWQNNLVSKFIVGNSY